MKKQNGITLIALVISIIVMLILAGVTINAVIGDDGIIAKTQVASIMSKFSSYKEELELNAVEEMEIYASSETIKNYIPSMSDKDIEKFVIMKRELLYIENNELEIKAAEACGIGTAQAADETTSNSINEVKAVIGGVINLSSNSGDSYKVPEDDFTVTTNTNDTSVGLIGTRLYDKNSINSETWNIVIEYNSANQEIARYGSGYYWLKAGETYVIDGKSMKFENDFVVDYANKTYIALSGRAVNWNLDATLAVTDGLVLNIDPMSLADGEWRQNASDSNFYDFYVKDNKTGKEENKEIQKTGDVVYNSINKSLIFNRNISEAETYGEGGYLKLYKNDVDFTDGFTFEMYFNIPFYTYINGEEGNTRRMALFSRMQSLDMPIFTSSLRCAIAVDHLWIKTYGSSSWYDSGINCNTDNPGNINIKNFGNIKLNQPSYVTCVWISYDETQSNEYKEKYYDEYMIENGVDKVIQYINGVEYASTYYGHDSYVKGLEVWNKDECPFFIGAATMGYENNVYYLNGEVYTTRLYTQPMTPDQVKDNYDTTLKYRSSF